MFCDRTDIAKPGLDTKRMVVGSSGLRFETEKVVVRKMVQKKHSLIPFYVVCPKPHFKNFSDPPPSSKGRN